MKKFFAFLFTFLLIICLGSPVSVKASSFSVTEFYTRSSVTGMFSTNYVGSLDTVDRQTLANWIFSVTNTDLTSEVIDYVNDYPYLSSIETGSSLLFTYNPFTHVIYAFQFSGVESAYLIYDNRYDLGVFTNALISGSNPQLEHYSSIMLDSQLNTPEWSDGTYSVTSYDDYRYVSLVGYPIALYGINAVLGLPEYAANNELNLSTIQANFAPFISDYESGIGNYTNYIDGLQVWNGEEMVDPVPDLNTEESNLNHMYFNSCDFGFCEPIKVSSFSNFGGAYFYVKYNVDDWVLNHIGDYKIEFHVDCYVGNQHFPFTTREALDPDLVLTIPFSYFDGFNYGFSTYITNQKIDKSFLKTNLYCIKPDQYSSFYNKINAVQSNDSLNHMLDELADNDLDFPFLFCYTNDLGTSVIRDEILTTQFINQLYYNNRFTITCNARLIDESGNESGWISREFDLVRGSSISTNNDGLTNENPFNDDSSEYLPDIPDNYEVIDNNGNGNGVNVYNMTPSDIKLVIDNGFEKFIAWYNSDPSTAEVSTGFWNSFGIFRNNPAADLYNEYFGFLPTGFKNIILGCATIGIVGGVFCAIRRKLT